MSVCDIKLGPFSLPAIIVIVGSILAIVALFLDWITISSETMGVVTILDSLTGMELLSNTEYVSDDFQKYLPLVIAIMGAIALIISIVSAFKPLGKVGSLVTLIIGVVMIALAIVTILWMNDSSDILIAVLKSVPAIGAYLAIVGAVLIALPPIAALLEKGN